MNGFSGSPCQNTTQMARTSVNVPSQRIGSIDVALILRMASGKARCTRKLRNWVVEQVESGQFPGVCWEDEAKTMFRIPWKHAGKQDFREDQDAAFFKVKRPGNPPLKCSGVMSARISGKGEARGYNQYNQLRNCQSLKNENAKIFEDFKMATAEHKPNTGLSVQLMLHIHAIGPCGGSAGIYNMLPLFTFSVS